MERRANLQLRQQQSNGHAGGAGGGVSSVSEPLTEVNEDAPSSAASTSVKESSFVFSFKRKSTRHGNVIQCC